VDKLLDAFFNLFKISIRQRGPELAPFCVRWPLFSSGPLTYRQVIMFAIRVNSCLLIVHPSSCFVEFRSKMVIHFVALFSFYDQ
jgi:hypothetical protein